jgi:hypothetical protein
MKNHSKELLDLIKNVKKSFGEKVSELERIGKLNNESQKTIKNTNIKINALNSYVDEINRLYTTNTDVIVKFRKRVKDIEQEITHLS